MARAIQTGTLRQQLGFSGVTISDALDMAALTKHFGQKDIIEKVSNAGVDIALMPVSITSPVDAASLFDLFQYVVSKVQEGS